VIRGIKTLEMYNVIVVQRVSGAGSLYFLTDKSRWKKELGDFYKVSGLRKATKVESSGVKTGYVE
jgi:hypothetical protein